MRAKVGWVRSAAVSNIGIEQYCKCRREREKKTRNCFFEGGSGGRESLESLKEVDGGCAYQLNDTINLMGSRCSNNRVWNFKYYC